MGSRECRADLVFLLEVLYYILEFDMLNSEVAYEGSYKNVLHGCTEIHTNGEQFAPLTWMPQSILITCLFLISVFRLLLVFCSLLMNVWTLEVI